MGNIFFFLLMRLSVQKMLRFGVYRSEYWEREVLGLQE